MLFLPLDDPRFGEDLFITRSKDTKTYARKRASSSGSIFSSTIISRPSQTLRASSSREDKFEDSVFDSCYAFIQEKIKIIGSSIPYLTSLPQPEWKRRS